MIVGSAVDTAVRSMALRKTVTITAIIESQNAVPLPGLEEVCGEEVEGLESCEEAACSVDIVERIEMSIFEFVTEVLYSPARLQQLMVGSHSLRGQHTLS